MKKQYLLLTTIALVLFFSIFISCSKDGDYEDVLPIASDDIVSNDLRTTVEIAILNNDTTGDFVVPSTVSIINGIDTDSNGTLDQLTVINEGVWNVNAVTGILTFTPLETFVGNPSQISYTVKDSDNNTSNAAIVTINALPIVSVNLENVPYTNLSDYHFFVGQIKNQIPSLNVLPYEPASSLFTDYAHKKRFVWMPNGTSATYNGDDNVFNFPTGAVLIKSFYYENVQSINNVAVNNEQKIIETRLLIKKSNGWYAYDYVWNAAQNEAVLESTNNGVFVPLTFTDEGTTRTIDYKVPSQTECSTCHKINVNQTGEKTIPIGPKPQNLNTIYNYSSGSENQITKWKNVGFLGNDMPALSAIKSTVDWRDTSKSLESRARSYIDMNCAHCHRDGGHCDYTPQRFNFSNTNLETVGLCLTPLSQIPNAPFVINGGNAVQSELFVRINTNVGDLKMPIIGRSVIHEEGVQLIRDWINSLPSSCR